jgi:hypothetical protein
MICIITFAAMNVIAWALLQLVTIWHQAPTPSARNPWLDQKGFALLSQVYPGRTESEINDLLNETRLVRTTYHPFAQTRMQATSGRYLNVFDPGFRSVGANQAAWPPSRDAINVFMFGGSTTLGGGVADDNTVASYLQEMLRTKTGQRINVFNFGTGAHFSSMGARPVHGTRC